MCETRKFPAAAVLSAITGVMVIPTADISSVYVVLGWMAGEAIYTHQLPRVSREAQAAMIAFCPSFSKTCDEADLVNRDNWREWLAVWLLRHGETIDVPKMTADQHERIDPLSELAERFPPDKIIIIGTE